MQLYSVKFGYYKCKNGIVNQDGSNVFIQNVQYSMRRYRDASASIMYDSTNDNN